ncbi:unnamed protein product [Calypogeia fissa]
MPSSRSSWRDAAFKRPIFHSVNLGTAMDSEPVTALGIPLTGLDTTVTPSAEAVAAAEREEYGDKVVITFERLLSEEEITTWVDTLNESLPEFHMQLVEQLINSLYVIQILSPTPDIDLAYLLDASPLHANETFASTNKYSPEFSPHNPVDFKQLVSVIIRRGSRFLYKFLDTILEPVGNIVHRQLESGLDQHCILALVETKLQPFIPQIKFLLGPERFLLIHLDYLGLQLRCYKCFSFAHLAASCDQNVYANLPRTTPVVRPTPTTGANTSPIQQALRRNRQHLASGTPASSWRSRPPRITPRATLRQCTQAQTHSEPQSQLNSQSELDPQQGPASVHQAPLNIFSQQSAPSAQSLEALHTLDSGNTSAQHINSSTSASQHIQPTAVPLHEDSGYTPVDLPQPNLALHLSSHPIPHETAQPQQQTPLPPHLTSTFQ